MNPVPYQSRLASYLFIKIGPHFPKQFDIVIMQHHALLLVHVLEALQYDSDEQVDKYERHNQYEAAEIENAKRHPAAPDYPSVGLDLGVSLLLEAVESGRALSNGV